MKKMRTLFLKDAKDLSKVTDEIDPTCLWVFDKGVTASQKFDGTACAIIDGKLYKRWDNKKDKPIPEGAIECQEADKITKHHPYWILCNPNNPADKWHYKAFNESLKDGTYELCGPKIQGNPESLTKHILIRHGLVQFDTIGVLANCKLFMADLDIEGIVFHHPDGRMCKIRKKDYGMKR